METTTKTEFTEAEKKELLEKIVALKQLPGLEINLCGSWVWIGGDTKPQKDQLKAAGCFWASKKKCWYWKPADYVKVNRKEWDMEKICDRFGSESFSSQGKAKVLIA